MAKNTATARYTILTRCLAALALMFVYVASTSAVLVGASTTSAQARGGGGRGGGGRGGGFRGGGFRGGGFRGGGFRGGGWGRGRGVGIYGGGGCYFSYRWGRYICPY
jgi:uncharacterized membrane protein